MQRLLVSMKTGDTRQTVGDCGFPYIHASSGGVVAKAICRGHLQRPAEALPMPSRTSVSDRGQGRRIAYFRPILPRR